MTTLELPDELWEKICKMAKEDGVEPLVWFEAVLLADKKHREAEILKRKTA